MKTASNNQRGCGGIIISSRSVRRSTPKKNQPSKVIWELTTPRNDADYEMDKMPNLIPKYRIPPGFFRYITKDERVIIASSIRKRSQMFLVDGKLKYQISLTLESGHPITCEDLDEPLREKIADKIEKGEWGWWKGRFNQYQRALRQS